MREARADSDLTGNTVMIDWKKYATETWVGYEGTPPATRLDIIQGQDYRLFVEPYRQTAMRCANLSKLLPNLSAGIVFKMAENGFTWEHQGDDIVIFINEKGDSQ